ncbi:hypothetical protein EF834_12030 [Rhodococcus spongiicola]|uniref:Uncharacterized protein n=1 Tax=Rhodococcus spongiicola TaxID=2487352 RepID=A0A438AUI8_9NOCA|nr:hypothetical protein EF834_12030 [Rhodococcus spongiicola]
MRRIHRHRGPVEWTAGSVGNDGRTPTLTPQQNPLSLEQGRVDGPVAQQKPTREARRIGHLYSGAPGDVEVAYALERSGCNGLGIGAMGP